jgi:hypothetical protein
MTPLEQKQRSEIGRLTQQVAELQTAKADMAIDNSRQRDTMEAALDLLTADSLKSSRQRAAKLLRDDLTHWEKTREQRKGRAA